MKLCERGIIGLDVPLVDYSSFQMLQGDPRVEQITARHVLSHQSGFQNWRTPDEPLKINFDPGSDFLYSGEGYFYLQSVISKLTGRINSDKCGTYEANVKVCATDISDFLQENVLVPFKMRSSAYAWSEIVAKNQASAHDSEGASFVKSHPTDIDMARYASSGGLLTTANDYANFLVALFSPRDNDPFRISKKSLEEMLRPQVQLREDQKIDSADAWALGWAVQQRRGGNVIVHSGGQSGFRSLTMASVTKRNAFVMLTNSDRGGFVLYNEELGKVLNRLFG